MMKTVKSDVCARHCPDDDKTQPPVAKKVENKATGNGVETLGASGW
jgi:hypothetical protein